MHYLASVSFTFVGVISEEGGGSNPPVLAIAGGLRRLGHRVVLIGDSRITHTATDRGFEVIETSDQSGLREFFGPAHFGEWASRLAIGDDLSDVDPFTNWAATGFEETAAAVTSASPDLVFGGLLTSALAERLARELGVPWAFVNPAYVFGPASPHQIEDDLAPGLPTHLFSTWLEPCCYRADVVIHATDPEFDPVPSLPHNHHQVGPLTLASSNPPTPHTGASASMALVSISTDMQGEEAIVHCAAEALGDLALPAVVTAPGRAEQLRREHPDIRIEEFAPHDELLPSSSVFITHAGHGSVMNGLAFGVPMVLVPWSRDQPGVARRAVELGAGVVIDRDSLSSSSMRAAVQRALHDETIAATASRISERLRHEDPVSEACRVLVEAI
jgi:hypothetical protein